MEAGANLLLLAFPRAGERIVFGSDAPGGETIGLSAGRIKRPNRNGR
jgi:hypothetical protein